MVDRQIVRAARTRVGRLADGWTPGPTRRHLTHWNPAGKMDPPLCGSPYRVTARVSRNSNKVPGGASTDLPWPISPVAAPIAAPAAGPPKARPTSDPAAALPAVFRPLRGPDCS